MAAAAVQGQPEPVRSRLLAAVEASAPMTVHRESDGDLTVVVDGVAVLRVDP
jgi:hypothetical protein